MLTKLVKINSQEKNANPYEVTSLDTPTSLGVKHFILVLLTNSSKYAFNSAMFVLTVICVGCQSDHSHPQRAKERTLFSHSNSAHILLNSASVQDAGWM